MNNVTLVIKETIGKSLLLKIGQKSIVIRKKRVMDRVFLEVSTTDANKYSIKFFIPLAF